MKHLSLVLLLHECILSTLADNSESCQRSHGSTCNPLETGRRAKTIEVANYAPEDEIDEEEDVDDADLINHMQMRLNVDIPLDSQAPKKVGKSSSTQVEDVQKDIQKQVPSKLNLAGAAGKPTTGSQIPMVEAAITSASIRALASEGALPPSFTQLQSESSSVRSGSQIVLGAVIGAVLVILGAFLATLLRGFVGRRKDMSEDELRTAGKAWMLEWALRLDPEAAEKCEKEDYLPIEAEMKLQAKKKHPPPMATGSDSGDTDEEEPEAEWPESDSGELLEDAVYVAEQVEFANRANEENDTGYGLDNIVRHADQICG